ncbi:MAG: phospholipase D-like domain-containing protein [Nanoarchaeota archaeon]
MLNVDYREDLCYKNNQKMASAQTMKPQLILLLFLLSCTPIAEIPREDNKPMEVYFCKGMICHEKLLSEFAKANDIKCALYSLNSKELEQILQTKNAEVIIDNNKDLTILEAKLDPSKRTLHDKFCILDSEEIITGSYNPTSKNSSTANNLIILHSKYLSQNYLQDFYEIKNRKKDQKVKYPVIILNNKTIENYFCPEDDCDGKVISTLEKAQQDIKFMTYSFTDDKIGTLLLEKSKTIPITGLFEKRQNSKWSEYNKLKEFSNTISGIHHKVFIIDNSIVITGSYNPTSNGAKRNDENVLIIHDESIAKKFLEEFENLKTKSN